MFYIYDEGGIPLLTCEKHPSLELLDATPSYTEALVIAKGWSNEESGIRLDWDSIKRSISPEELEDS